VRALSKLPLACSFAAAAALLGCAQEPSLRSYVYSQLDSGSVVVSPRLRPPQTGNNFPYIPGNLTRPYRVTPAEPERRLAAEWQTGRYCPISPKVFRFSASRPDGTGADITYRYEFNPFFALPGFVESEKRRAISDLNLRDNDLKYIDRISIVIKNLKIYSADRDVLGSSPFRSLVAGCYRYRKAYQYEIAKIYTADFDIRIESVHGFAFDAGVLRAKILRQYLSEERSQGAVIAVQPQLISN
jgi:hypothetical protein